ncbi:type 4b pilus protein PilO2 [Burkholderia cepacia]|uniref:Uncharacterized protein n=1 Tax=Burkholderia cepacia TaxID=292 RepID=A0AAX2RR76_BURCE|nr:type 4b pilus protein PilO2 [Burkholderia cepacia]TET01712.1 hypothetical protein E3D36_16895 [Burkholderia cepacia]TEU47570.1 hypothetical protein E3D37_16325 [Burkholderia cepacia]TEU53442.1 hypothetical protein E3D38_11910 [Burkholderia cepacia]TEV02203.1 hypothetical protein E3D40_13645 [Burkholderia cepacia]TEV07859.1 hypothetical protein E3D44_18840 [Burkholderia cepacia]
MILNIGGKSLAFGMRWQILVRAEAPGREARAAKSPLMWVDASREYFGILGQDEVLPKGKERIYSAAQALLNIPQSSTNMLLVLVNPEADGYLVCGVMQKRPRNGFDLANVDDAALGELLARFADLCGDDGFELLGDAPLDGISALTVTDLSEAADEHCILRSSGSIARYVPYVLVILAASTAVGFGLHYYKKKQAEEALAKQKSPAQLYAESLEAQSKSPTYSPSQIDAWATWAKALPMSVGGWDIADATCNLSAPQQQFSCVITYKRGKSPLSTNRTFVDAAPKEWQSIQFNDDAKSIQVAIPVKVPVIPSANVIAAATSPRTISLELGSKLQSLVNVSKKAGLGAQFDIFALPVGVIPSSVPAPVLTTTWTLEGPFRVLDALRGFPQYTTLDRISLTVSSVTQSSVNSSIAMISASGNVYAKQ